MIQVPVIVIDRTTEAETETGTYRRTGEKGCQQNRTNPMAKRWQNKPQLKTD